MNTDLSGVAAWREHERDNGSSEVQVGRTKRAGCPRRCPVCPADPAAARQVATLTARITQLTSHLQQHRKDHSTTRGLYQMLGKRKRLLLYLYNTERWAPARAAWRQQVCRRLCRAGRPTAVHGLRRERYQELITGLGIRPLKIRAGRNLQVQMATPTGEQQEQFKRTGKVPKELKKEAAMRS